MLRVLFLCAVFTSHISRARQLRRRKYPSTAVEAVRLGVRAVRHRAPSQVPGKRLNGDIWVSTTSRAAMPQTPRKRPCAMPRTSLSPRKRARHILLPSSDVDNIFTQLPHETFSKVRAAGIDATERSDYVFLRSSLISTLRTSLTSFVRAGGSLCCCQRGGQTPRNLTGPSLVRMSPLNPCSSQIVHFDLPRHNMCPFVTNRTARNA